MIKSELVKRISSQNPHLFERDIEKVVNAIFDEMVEALHVVEIERVECGAGQRQQRPAPV